MITQVEMSELENRKSVALARFSLRFSIISPAFWWYGLVPQNRLTCLVMIVVCGRGISTNLMRNDMKGKSAMHDS